MGQGYQCGGKSLWDGIVVLLSRISWLTERILSSCWLERFDGKLGYGFVGIGIGFWDC